MDALDNDMKLVKDSEPIDLTGWTFECGPLDSIIADAMTSALKNTLGESPPYLFFAYQYAYENGVTDPLTIYLGLPFAVSGGMEINCHWSCSLASLIDYWIDIQEESPGRIEDNEAIERTKKLITAIRGLADKLQTAIGG